MRRGVLRRTRRSRQRDCRRGCFALAATLSIALPGSRSAAEEPSRAAALEPDLTKRIDLAIDAGARWLLSQADDRGLWPAFTINDSTYDVGPTALACLALIHAGISRSDDRLKRAFEFILTQPPRRTYEVTLSIMALEAKATPPRDALRDSYANAFERSLLPPESSFMKKAAEWLVSTRKGAIWSYPQGNGDHSNTQVALLALKAASRCGIKVPKDVWYDACQHFLRVQEKSGPPVTVTIDRGPDGSGKAQLSKRPGAARGWTYDKPCPPSEAYGSMTCIGIASIILCRSELAGYPRYSGKVSSDIDQSVRDGLAWLQQYWSIAEHPRRKLDYHYYYLYGVERVGILADLVKVGEHDWFREGAEFLLSRQEPDGRWRNQAGWGSDVINTAFALLFLERSTVPVTGTTAAGAPQQDAK